MWIMTLKSGGVADSTGARAGVICGLAAGGFSLSFSHHTREPGLIACLSFAGATVIILGVDMFSRAGLKEFWLYIWNLNPSIFPLGTKTYPLNRGIKVEIAAIIIIAVCGAMSQMRLWKMVKEKRAKRAEKRKRDEEERAIVDEERNREFMKQHNKEHKEWEREFGNKAMDSASAFSHPDSLTHDSTYKSDDPSFKKSSVSIQETSRGLELPELNFPRRSSEATLSTRRNSKDKDSVVASEEPMPRSKSHRPKQSNPEALQALEKISERPSRNASVNDHVGSNSDAGHSEEGASVDNWPLGPEVKPLPFNIPDEHGSNAENHDDDVQSLATAGDTVMLDEIIHAPGKDKGPLAGRTLKRTSGAGAHTESSKRADFDVPHFDDARSSVAATLDGISSHGGSLPALSRSGTPLPDADSKPGAGIEGEKTYTVQKRLSAGDLVEQAFRDTGDKSDVDVDANRRHSVQLPGAAPQSTLGSLANLKDPDVPESEKETPAIVATHARSVSEGSHAKPETQPVTLTKDSLPEAQSTTVHLYRTNEWAKHQALAETPEADNIAPPSEEGVTVDYGKEFAAPVNVRSLSQTAFSNSKSKSSKKMSSNNPYLKHQQHRSSSSPQQSSSNLGRTKSGPAVPVYSSVNQPSMPKRSTSNPNGVNTDVDARHSSTNLLKQPVAEHGDGRVTPLGPKKSSHRISKSPQPVKDTNNLIRLRENRMQSRLSTMSFAQLPDASTSTVDTAGLGSEREAGEGSNVSPTTNPTPNTIKEEEDDDDIPLAKRQSQLKRASSQQPTSHYQLGRSPTNPYHNSAVYSNTINAHNAGVGGLPYDAHQPSRGATVSAATRESRLANWRASMVNVSNPNEQAFSQPNIKLEAKRQHLLESQRKQGEEKMKKEMDQRMKENVMDQKMRSGEVTDLHRKKLQQMQRQASKKATETNN